MQKPTLLVVLQCPWKRQTLTQWNPSVWLKELKRSRTGKRLFQEIIPPGLWNVKVCNASPQLAETPDESFPANSAHLRRCIQRTKPDLILACGAIAQQACATLQVLIPVLTVPHPAHRTLSKKQTEAICRTLAELSAHL